MAEVGRVRPNKTFLLRLGILPEELQFPRKLPPIQPPGNVLPPIERISRRLKPKPIVPISPEPDELSLDYDSDESPEQSLDPGVPVENQVSPQPDHPGEESSHEQQSPDLQHQVQSPEPGKLSPVSRLLTPADLEQPPDTREPISPDLFLGQDEDTVLIDLEDCLEEQQQPEIVGTLFVQKPMADAVYFLANFCPVDFFRQMNTLKITLKMWVWGGTVV
jgi:hypothetical protein